MGKETTLKKQKQNANKTPTLKNLSFMLRWSTYDFLCCLNAVFICGFRVSLHRLFKLKLLVSLWVCELFGLEDVFQGECWLNPRPWVLFLSSLLCCSQTKLGSGMNNTSILTLVLRYICWRVGSSFCYCACPNISLKIKHLIWSFHRIPSVLYHVSFRWTVLP